MAGRHAILIAALLAASAVAGYQAYRALSTPSADEAAAEGGAVGAPGSARIGERRPDFALPDPDGVSRSIAEWDGKALIVNFWAPWCAPCREEIPILIELAPRLAAQDIQIIGVAVDQPEAVRRFAEEVAFNYPILIGEQAAVDAADGFGASVVGLPLTAFTDHDGKILDVHLGELTRQDILDFAQALGPL